MTLDMHPSRWRQIVKLFCLWLELPEDQAEHLIDLLPQSEQNRFDALLLVLKGPQKALRELEARAKRVGQDDVETLIDKLPRQELEKLVKAALKRGKGIDKLISKMCVEELREFISLHSYPKDALAFLVFLDGLDPKRQKSLLA